MNMHNYLLIINLDILQIAFLTQNYFLPLLILLDIIKNFLILLEENIYLEKMNNLKKSDIIFLFFY